MWCAGDKNFFFCITEAESIARECGVQGLMLDPNCIQLRERIGSGNYSDVWLGYYNVTSYYASPSICDIDAQANESTSQSVITNRHCVTSGIFGTSPSYIASSNGATPLDCVTPSNCLEPQQHREEKARSRKQVTVALKIPHKQRTSQDIRNLFLEADILR